MEYMDNESGGWKKWSLFGGIGLVIIGLGVGVFLLLRQRAAGTDNNPTSVNQPLTNTGSDQNPGAPNQQPPKQPVKVILPPPNVYAAPKVDPGLNRLLTTEEKKKYGFSPGQEVYIVTTSPKDGSSPQAAFYPKTTSRPLPGQDSDNDLLPDTEEVKYGTDPHKADTDGDGLTDYDEIFVTHTDPLKSDSVVKGCPDGAVEHPYQGMPEACVKYWNDKYK
jgi:hypothetical protein